MNLFLKSFTESDFFGKSIFFVLFILSCISWIILIYKVWLYNKEKKECYAFEHQFEQKKKTPLNVHFESQKQFEFLNSFFQLYKILKEKTLEILEKNRFFSKQTEKDSQKAYLSEADLKLLEAHLTATISKQLKIFERNLFVLSIIVTLAPFLGLLGTVWGILITFSELAFHTNNTFMLAGLSMALATTVVGLIVAIPALIAYSYLKNAVRCFRKDMEYFSHNLISTIEMQYRKS